MKTGNPQLDRWRDSILAEYERRLEAQRERIRADVRRGPRLIPPSRELDADAYRALLAEDADLILAFHAASGNRQSLQRMLSNGGGPSVTVFRGG